MADGSNSEKNEAGKRCDEELEVRFGCLGIGSAQRLPSQQESEAQSTSASPFLRLAPELRNRIHEYVLIEKDPIDLVRKWSMWPQEVGGREYIKVDCEPHDTENVVRQPGLTRTCRTIRLETLPMFYALNGFEGCLLDLERQSTRTTLKWLLASGEKRALLRGFTAEVYPTQYLTMMAKYGRINEQQLVEELDRQLLGIGLKIIRPAENSHGGRLSVHGRGSPELVKGDDAAVHGDVAS